MNVYFCGSIRGDRSRVETLRFMVAAIESLGHHVLTKHIVSDDPKETAKHMTMQQVYERDIHEFLPQADIIIAEVSGPSFGVGFEVGYAIAKGEKPVYLFYERQLANEDRISNLARGCTEKQCTIIEYTSNEEITQALRKALGDNA